MRRFVIMVAALAGAVAPAAAQAQGGPSPGWLSADWTVTLGVEGRVLPAFEGSNRYLLAPFPIIEARRAGTPRPFTSARDGLSFAIVEIGRFRFGPAGKIKLPRDQRDDPALAGLGDVSWAFEAGAFAEYWVLPWLRTRAELRQGFGGHHGLVAELSSDAVLPVSERLTLSAGPRLSLATADALRPYFGVNAAQSLASGLPVFQPGGGVKAVGFGAQARQQWSREWASTLSLEYDRLVGDAARSPILSRNGSANQLTFSLGLSYAFDISLR
jgi:outer membrane protein